MKNETGLFHQEEASGSLRCPRCGEDLKEYPPMDMVYRIGDHRPYCSGECVIAMHRRMKRALSG